MSKKVTINGKEYQVYDGKGEPSDGDNLVLVIPLKKNSRSYKDKEGNDKVSVTYAEVGNKFGGHPVPASDGTLNFKLSVYPVKFRASVATQVVAL